MYSQKVLDIFRNPQNAGGLQGSNGTGKVGDVEKGDLLKLYIKVDEQEVITEAKFKTFGSVAAIAVSSVLTQVLIGKTIAQAQQLTAQEIAEVIGELPIDKMYVLSLAEELTQNTLSDYFKKKEKEEKK